MLRLLGVLDSHHLPQKGSQRSTQKTAAEAEKATSHSDRARQTPELLGPGKGTKRSPNQICTSEGYLSGLDWGGLCSLGPASDGSWLSIIELEQFVRSEQGQAQQG